MKKAILIGAGQTGRGFIAPILKQNDYKLIFVDKNKELINQLNKKKEYKIRYFGDVKEPVNISGYEAYTTDDVSLLEHFDTVDLVTTSVFASNLSDTIPLLSKASKRRSAKSPLQIVCCENGVNVKQPLVDAGLYANITEGVIFCTTLNPDEHQLDLVSEDYPELPVDGKVEGIQLDIKGLPMEPDFPSLIQRKIYTYNFMSALVAYLGDYQHYELYSEAGNDKDIAGLIDKVVPVISRIIAKEYKISYEQQLAFTMRAVHKFQNKEIYDTIYRNARQVSRKLQKNERLYEPLQLAVRYEEPTIYFSLVTAAAIQYGVEKEGLCIDELISIYSDLGEAEKEIKELYELMKKHTALKELIRICDDHRK